jgi:copper chaperone NosL
MKSGAGPATDTAGKRTVHGVNQINSMRNESAKAFSGQAGRERPNNRLNGAFIMLIRRLKRCLVAAVLVLAGVQFGYAGEPVKPPKEVKCPVCGMFVAKYLDWVGQIHFKDGSVEFFDGAKDLFKYYLDMKKYHSARTQKEIVAIYVTEYYDLRSIDARKAFFVVGSEVYGPMGRELISLTTRQDAEGFLKDHKGRLILRFEDITPKLIVTLDD